MRKSIQDTQLSIDEVHQGMSGDSPLSIESLLKMLFEQLFLSVCILRGVPQCIRFCNGPLSPLAKAVRRWPKDLESAYALY